MQKLTYRIWIGVFLFWFLSLFLLHRAYAHPLNQQEQSTATDLINAVNNLRLSHGLGVLTVHPILTQTAQSQADALLATQGAIGHGRPNGISFTQQLLMLGYPLSGDLSLGGYRSENYVCGKNLTVQAAIELWLGDDPHTNTMLSEYRSDIGAGVAIDSDGTVYYVIDTALRTRSGLPQPEATLYFPNTGGTTGTLDPQSPLVSQYIVPVTVATARPDGDVFHKVQYGQSLWSIAIQYGTTIEQIQRYNNLGEDTTVYVGQILLVQKKATQPAPVPTATATFPAVVKTQIVPTSTQIRVQTVTPTATTLPTVVSQTNGQVNVSVFPIIISFVVLVAVLGLWVRKRR